MGPSARPRIRLGGGDVLHLRIELEGVAPTVWRRVAVSARASLHELHEVIQQAMDRRTGEGYAFEVDGVRYVDADDEVAAGVRADATDLEMLELHQGSRFLHIAEHHGEPWRHVLSLEQLHPRLVGQRLPICLAGARAAPPDDCDGARDYAELLAALAEPLDPRSAERSAWLPDGFDPDYVDLVAINAALARTPMHRPADERMRHRK